MQQVRVHIPALPIFERVVRASTVEVANLFGLSDERTQDLQLAVSEAVNNAIDHGSSPNGHPIDIVFELNEPFLEVHVHDSGSGLETLPTHRVIDEYSLDQGKTRGLGFTLINALVDEYTIQHAEHGTILTLRLLLHAKE